MHWQAFQFISSCKHYLGYNTFDGYDILEVGSHNVNGGIRELFVPGRYVGLDLSEGPGVDVVTSGHEYRDSEQFDLTISCECFEHNPYYIETFKNMVSLTKDSGVVLITCASKGRPEHGTTRTNPSDSPGTSAINWDYYKNLVANDFLDNIDFGTLGFKYFKFFYNSSSSDLYFIGVKSDVLAEKLICNESDFIKYVKLIETDSLNEKDLGLINYDIPLHPDYLFEKYIKGCTNVISERLIKLTDIEFHSNDIINYLKYLLAKKENKYSGKYIYKALVLSKNTNRYPFFINAYADYLSEFDKLKAISCLKLTPGLNKNMAILYKISDLYYLAKNYNKSIKYANLVLIEEPENYAALNIKCHSLKKIKSLEFYPEVKKLFNVKNTPNWVKNGFK